jgi:hypothetical protein
VDEGGELANGGEKLGHLEAGVQHYDTVTTGAGSYLAAKGGYGREERCIEGRGCKGGLVDLRVERLIQGG